MAGYTRCLLFAFSVLIGAFAFQIQNADNLLESGTGNNKENKKRSIARRPDFNALFRDYSRFIPSTPSPEEINCEIEVETVSTRIVGGKCVNMGRASNFKACQSGVYLDLFNQECLRMAQQERNQATDTSK